MYVTTETFYSTCVYVCVESLDREELVIPQKLV